jgi:hypothetical protein
VVAVSKGYVPVAITLEVEADYVAVPISITSGEKDPLRNIENVQLLLDKLRDATRKSPEMKLRQGAVSLSIMQGEESSGFSSSYRPPNPSSSTNLFLVAPLTKTHDVYQATRELLAIGQSVAKSDQTRVTYGTTSLGLESPERFRPRLLALIQKDVEQTRNSLGNPKSFEVSGLESPVVVMQRDDRSVIVYIPYRVKVGQ